jgi:putative transposase
LYPADRNDKKKSRAIDDQTAANLIALRKSMPTATVAVLIKTIHQRRLITPGTHLKTTTVYRFLHNQQLMKPAVPCVDRRKFEAELPNDLWHYAASRIMLGKACSPSIFQWKVSNRN